MLISNPLYCFSSESEISTCYSNGLKRIIKTFYFLLNYSFSVTMLLLYHQFHIFQSLSATRNLNLNLNELYFDVQSSPVESSYLGLWWPCLWHSAGSQSNCRRPTVGTCHDRAPPVSIPYSREATAAVLQSAGFWQWQ